MTVDAILDWTVFIEASSSSLACENNKNCQNSSLKKMDRIHFTWIKTEYPAAACFIPSTDAAWINLDLTFTVSGHQDVRTSLLFFCCWSYQTSYFQFQNGITCIVQYRGRLARNFHVEQSITAILNLQFLQVFIVVCSTTTCLSDNGPKIEWNVPYKIYAKLLPVDSKSMVFSSLTKNTPNLKSLPALILSIAAWAAGVALIPDS